ncbi:small-conductance mechanosensitive channel [Bifidobacterium lemurum]|uniref:Small-conductance mechanosensitive channel n=1 Tax=Bifidobacterium lemurum TaxID=1603886 RepID=A0A261FRZ4_9BIFI|nr:mechanosensitive ion channel domain-containing protein [Bifidobacterium lemurum]OZG61960.1 small-conductance mechanosensitive channel [Bifidobacterium lemurum]
MVTTEPMSKRLKIKIAALLAVVLASVAVTGLLLAGVQTQLSLSGYTDEMRQQNEQLKETLEQADLETQESTESFDETFRSKAESIAYMANNNAGFEATDAKMKELKTLLAVDNVLVVAENGDVVAKAQDTQADFHHARFNQLRTVFETGEPSDAVEVSLPDKDWNYRYYAAAIDDDTMAVVETSPERLDDIIDSSSSLTATLKDITVGQQGYMMAVSAQDYTVQYHPNADLIGTDALTNGLNVDDLEDGKFFHMNFDGTRLYSGVTKIGDTYYISSVPEHTLSASRNVTVGVILFAFIVVMAAVVMYGVFVLRDDENRGHRDEDLLAFGPLRYNRKVGGKAAVLSVVGLVVVIVVSFYMQTLFALSSESLVNADRASSIAQTMSNTTKRANSLKQEYNTRYLNKVKVAAYVLDQNPELANKSDLTQLADALGVDMISVFDEDGVRTASTEPDRSFTLSENPEDQSYAFRQLLQGVESLVQDPTEDDSTGAMRQYIGVPTYDDEGLIDGLVQIAVHPQMLEELLTSVEIDNVLDGVQVGKDGFAFAVSKSNGRLVYFPDSLVQGKKATAVGMTEAQLKGGYSDYLTIAGTTYYASSVETSDYYLYVTGGDSELMAERLPLTLATAGIALVCLLLVFLILAFERDPKARAKKVAAGAGAIGAADAAAERASAASGSEGDASVLDAHVFEVRVPGTERRMKTQSAASRWLNQSFDWDEKTPEGKLGTVMRWFFGLFVVIVFIGVMFKDEIFGSQSVFSYVLGGGWNKGLNIFAITAALMSACVIITVAGVAQELLRMLTGVLGARGETMVRLLCSVIKYGSIIGILYYCMALLGVDTATLLASAGLLTLAIGFGAQQLVSDILSGLFIIFEGEFRVGDVIQVGSMGGTVIEIGVRTTKIDDGSGNILVLRNSEISNVMNKTKLDSYASVDVTLEYGESLPRVENILERELPNIKKRLPAILDGPFYKGVAALNPDGTAVIRIVARCVEGNRGQLERDLKREMKLIISKHGILTPFQQVVVHEPAEAAKPSLYEMREADRFNEEQKESAKLIGNEEDDDEKE